MLYEYPQYVGTSDKILDKDSHGLMHINSRENDKHASDNNTNDLKIRK